MATCYNKYTFNGHLFLECSIYWKFRDNGELHLKNDDFLLEKRPFILQFAYVTGCIVGRFQRGGLCPVKMDEN